MDLHFTNSRLPQNHVISKTNNNILEFQPYMYMYFIDLWLLQVNKIEYKHYMYVYTHVNLIIVWFY